MASQIIMGLLRASFVEVANDIIVSVFYRRHQCTSQAIGKDRKRISYQILDIINGKKGVSEKVELVVKCLSCGKIYRMHISFPENSCKLYNEILSEKRLVTDNDRDARFETVKIILQLSKFELIELICYPSWLF